MASHSHKAEMKLDQFVHPGPDSSLAAAAAGGGDHSISFHSDCQQLASIENSEDGLEQQN